MTNNDIRNEWEKHFGNTMPEKELDDAFDKVMSSADRREKAQSAIMRIGLRQRIRRILGSGNAYFRPVDYIET